MQPVTSATIAAGTAGRLCPTGASTTPAPPRIGVASERMPAAIVEARMPPRSRTLGDLLDETARALLAVGVRKGDRVAVLLPNRPEWLVAAFAIGKLGAITVGVSTFSAPREIAWTLEHCRPAAILTMEAFRGRSYLDALYATCPELATSSPGELRSERLPELRAVVSVDSRRHDGVYRLGDFAGRASAIRTEALHA